jgi:hypothetical protein
MKKEFPYFTLLIAMVLVLTTGCKKDKEEQNTTDPSNRTLINIPLAELRNILKGDWLLKKSSICGVAGCSYYNVPAGQENIFSFLPLDSVKQVSSTGTVLVYDKAVITQSGFDNAWVYQMSGNGGSSIKWEFTQIKNDTLLGRTNQAQGGELFLTKRP